MKAPSRAPALPASAALAEVEAMIVGLTELRQTEFGRERKADYQAAIDRLHALAYRLERDAAPGRTIGLPTAPAQAAKAAAPAPTSAKAAPKPSQAALPLGPVVIARKPRPR